MQIVRTISGGYRHRGNVAASEKVVSLRTLRNATVVSITYIPETAVDDTVSHAEEVSYIYWNVILTSFIGLGAWYLYNKKGAKIRSKFISLFRK